MGIGETLLFYLIIGLAVAAAVSTHRPVNESRAARAGNTVAALFFWPIYLPVLLAPADQAPQTNFPEDADQMPVHFHRIQTVKRELQEALGFMSKRSSGPFHNDPGRFEELFAAWEAQAQRLRQLDHVLSTSRQSLETSPSPADQNEPARQFEAARQQNLNQLAVARDQAERQLVLSLTHVRELISAIYVAELTGSMETRAEELIQEIADSLDGMFQVAGWHAPRPVETMTS